MDRRDALSIGLPFAVAGVILVTAPWHGPIVLSLSADHGIDAGDLFAFPFVLASVALARRRLAPRDGHGWAAPAAAVVLGTLMLLAGVVGKAGGGPLVPAAGGTFDGTIRETSGVNPVRVDVWSYVATTWDGSVLRLYINGRQVSHAVTTGTLQAPSTPLWIGGNQPYGEHFAGFIDELRIYDRALSENELRGSMFSSVKRAAGLVAGYSFDTGAGAVAVDDSGHGNSGRISGARWAAGVSGAALYFDGRTAKVRVPASASLNLHQAMTLSAWIRPTVLQNGWRTIVQRQADAYLLTAGSDREDRLGLIDDARAGLIAAVALWFLVVIATRRSPWTNARRRTWWLPVALFVLGAVIDAAFVPSGTLVSPALVALWLAATASSTARRAGFLLAAGAWFAVTALSLADAAGVGGALERNDGSVARAIALGVLFVIAGAGQFAATARARRLS